MVPALSVRYVVGTLVETLHVPKTKVEVLQVAVDFVNDKITKAEVSPSHPI